MSEPAKPKEIEVRIYSMATTNVDAIIFLEEIGGNRLLPIWIGPVEGQAIAIKFSGIPLPRPFTHDLMISIVTGTGHILDRIVIDRVQENTFFASVYLRKDGVITGLDARPSDALALAVRAGSPIYVTEEVMGRAQLISKPITEDEVKDFKNKLHDLKPKDIFGDLKPTWGGDNTGETQS